ncbi:3,4-dihydroxy-2-butanone-4-phosphate synthase [Maricaulis sp. D1M11]|uniref:3,4-dihydroxy-2-butanone-4-phosphate synthase n=1 Tax=Maricaulis sp. D1M11 TaxID=3076117 RepID=UPI0039B556D6
MSDLPLSPIEDIIEDARNGRMFILVDAEDRENEGDLVIPGKFATPDAINFMAKHGRGLICLALTEERSRDLGLESMSKDNGTQHQTAFTVSIEAREGVTTGISAHDRARTIEVATDPARGVDDIVTPGHVFPLVARDGGVLVRAGHTEASVDVARLAGAGASGVICEIMNEDGTMSRLPDLIAFAQLHGLKIGTIEDLIAYRRKNDRFIERRMESDFESDWGGPFKLYTFRNRLDGSEHVALVKGTPNQDTPTLVRMHKVSFFDDVLHRTGPRGDLVEAGIRALAASDEPGVMVFIRETSQSAIEERLGARPRLAEGEREARRLREYGVGAQILLDLGVREMVLLTTTPQTIVGLEGYGLSVRDERLFPET